MVKQIKKNYHTPTPVKIRKIADSLLIGLASIGGITALNDYPKVGLVIAVTGAVLKFISDFLKPKE